MSDAVIGGTIIDLPVPPSVNRIWRANKGGPNKVSRSDEYKRWIKAADALSIETGQLRGIHPIIGKFEAHIVIKRCVGDLDNRAKGVLDYLQSRAVIANDKYCERLVMEWGDAPTGCRVTVRRLPNTTVDDVLRANLPGMQAIPS